MKLLRILVLLVIAALVGLGCATAMADLKGAQELVDKDPAITAYKVFDISLGDPMAPGEFVKRQYRLPLIVPMPEKTTHKFRGGMLGPLLAYLQFIAIDGTHKVTFLLTFPGLEGLVVSYYIEETEEMKHYIYDKDKNPQPATKEELQRLIDSYDPGYL